MIDMLWKISDGRPTEYDSLMGKDIFEFFHILKSHESLMARKLKSVKSK